MPHTFKEIFGEGIGYAVKDESIDSSFVSSCDLDLQNRTLFLKLESNNYISEEIIFAVKQRIVKDLKNVHLAVSHTTRPIRPKEVEGVDYHFIDNNEFREMKENYCFIETRSYNTKIVENGETKDAVWNYGYAREEFENYEYCIAIVDVTGYEELKEYFKPKGVIVTPIYVKVDEDVLKKRIEKRGDLLVELDRKSVV